jgi:hypothetical protein
MANVSSPFGFRQFGRREGGAPTAGQERAFILSSDPSPYFTGDTVALSTTSLVRGYLTNTGSSGNIGMADYGVFLGCEYYNPNVGRVVWSSYFPGNVGSSSPVNAYICNDPDQLYICQGSSGAVIGSSQIGFGFPHSISGSSLGNTLSGQSVMTLTSSQPTGLSSNAHFVLVDMYSNFAPVGVNGTSTTAEGLQIVVVQPNNFQRKATLTFLST